jgi:3-isopropylmalate/(R)-2-methylmalate dehydratase small subunit
MERFVVHTGTAVPLRRGNVDTDQIIPVRFLNYSRRTGHADALFADWRRDPGFVLNQPRHRDATILVAGPDFGTGSSREYAVWALQNYGFRAVLAARFGDIFRENALLNGLLAVVLPLPIIEWLWDVIEAEPRTPVTVDLAELVVSCRELRQTFDLDPRLRERLLAGVDQVTATLEYEQDIRHYEIHRRPGLPTTR